MLYAICTYQNRHNFKSIDQVILELQNLVHHLSSKHVVHNSCFYHEFSLMTAI